MNINLYSVGPVEKRMILPSYISSLLCKLKDLEKRVSL
jgi:hypothetical protein